MNKFCLVAFLVSGSALAHRPYFADGAHGSLSDSFEIEDPDISMVLYGELTCDSSELWLSFESEADYGVYLQLGVPEIDRLEDFRPSMALLHPSLPSAEEPLPFSVPDGYGVKVWHSDIESDPEAFYEPFTQTSSWVWQEETVVLSEAGEGFVVAWNPSGWTGKAWVAVGTIEDFSGADWSDFATWNEKVNDFHETSEALGEEEFCEPEVELESEGMEQEGCSTSSASGRRSPLSLLLLMGLFWQRRERKDVD